MRVLVPLFALLCALPAHAQEQRLQDALKRMQAQNQRLAADKAQLEREKHRSEQERAAALKARDALEATLKSSRGAVALSAAALERAREESRALEAKLAEAAAREQALKAGLAQAEQLLAAARADGERLRKRVANQSGTIGYWQAKTESCQAKNGELAAIGFDLLQRYRFKTCGDVEREAEPFTGIGRARLENMIEEYRDSLGAQRFDARRDAAPREAKR